MLFLVPLTLTLLVTLGIECKANPLPEPQSGSDLDYYPDTFGSDDLDDYDSGRLEVNPDKADSDIPKDEDGNYVIGDMTLSPEQYKADYLGEDFRSGISGERYRWPNGIIPFRLDSSLSSSERGEVMASIGRFNQIMNGCVKIREVSSSDRAYVNVRKGRGGCGSSSVGRQGRSQNLNISPGCFSDRTIMHEFIHAIGFYHEQSRPDRDRYVTIVTENISPSNRYNFRLRSNDLTFNVPYDGLSIMHYTSKAFSRNGKDTIVSKIPGVPTSRLGRGGKMTKYDVLKIRRMYNCREAPEPVTLFPPVNPINPITGIVEPVIGPDQIQTDYETGDYTSLEGDYETSSQLETGDYGSVGSDGDYY